MHMWRTDHMPMRGEHSDEYFRSDTSVEGQTSTYTRPLFLFCIFFALILQTHTNTPHILHTYTPYPTGPSLMPTPFSGDYQPPPTTTGAQPPYLPEGEHSVA